MNPSFPLLAGYGKGLVSIPGWAEGNLLWIGIAVTLLVLALLAFFPAKKVILRFGRLTWDRREFCRHFLITGDTGSGKTTCGINQILSQITTNVPDWGGLVLGVKGDEFRFISKLTAAHGRKQDLIHLQVRPDGESTRWKPPHRLNLVGDRSLPWTAHAKMIVDTGASLVEGKQSAFFRPMAQLAIANAFELLDALGKTVTITNAYQVLTTPSLAAQALEELKHLPDAGAFASLIVFFESTFTQAKAYEQREAIEGTIKTFLGFFLDEDIAAVFSSDEPDTFWLSDVDFGKIITVTMPQRLVSERRYVQTHLKLLLYLHTLGRFQLPDQEREDRNLLLLVADEFQDIATATEDGMSDHKMVDRVRAAGLAVVAAVQSEVSLDPVVGMAKRKVLSLNLRSRLIFRAADPEGATASAEFIGKRIIWRKSRTSKHFQPLSTTRHQAEDYRVKPTRLLRLKDLQVAAVHPSKRYSILRPRQLL